MNRYCIVVLTLFFLISCEVPFGNNRMGYEELNEPLFSSWRIVSSHKYIPDNNDYWKSPIEFERDGGGDCEDFAIALVYRLGQESSMVFIRTATNVHALVEWHNFYVDPQIFMSFYRVENIKIIRVYNYDDTMKEATRWGTKAID